jgi:hypothetical protein
MAATQTARIRSTGAAETRMTVMIQGYDPRTGQPTGDPVPETDGAQVDAIAEAAAVACVPWEQADRPGARRPWRRWLPPWTARRRHW